MGYNHKLKFDIGQYVTLDGTEIVARVISIAIRDRNVYEYQVSWFNHGEIVSTWVFDWRLTPWSEED